MTIMLNTTQIHINKKAVIIGIEETNFAVQLNKNLNRRGDINGLYTW